MTEHRPIPGTVARAGCQWCDWRGPARRSPDEALEDARAHRDECGGAAAPRPVAARVLGALKAVAGRG